MTFSDEMQEKMEETTVLSEGVDDSMCDANLVGFTSEMLLIELIRRNIVNEAPATRTFVDPSFEIPVSVGVDHFATINIDGEALGALING